MSSVSEKSAAFRAFPEAFPRNRPPVVREAPFKSIGTKGNSEPTIILDDYIYSQGKYLRAANFLIFLCIFLEGGETKKLSTVISSEI